MLLLGKHLADYCACFLLLTSPFFATKLLPNETQTPCTSCRTSDDTDCWRVMQVPCDIIIRHYLVLQVCVSCYTGVTLKLSHCISCVLGP